MYMILNGTESHEKHVSCSQDYNIVNKTSSRAIKTYLGDSGFTFFLNFTWHIFPFFYFTVSSFRFLFLAFLWVTRTLLYTPF